MKKRLFLIILLLIATPVLAQEVTLTFYSPDQKDFTDYFMTLKVDNEYQKDLLTGSTYSFNSPEKELRIEVALDSLTTPTPDFYGLKKISNDKETIGVFPIGYLQGSVLDLQGNLVPNAKLEFTCFSPFTLEFPEMTDKTGFFSVPNIPVGKCLVIASASKSVGSMEVEIVQGQATKVEIVLEKEIATSLDYLTFVFIILIIVGATVFVIFYLNRKGKYKEKKQKVKELSSSKQTVALLRTLNEKEKKIVNFLLENKNKSSQAKIRHATSIPRTSLSRVLQTLERKKIIEIKKSGKMVSISLTSFFLGKE